jgi:hypothetical protein
VTFRLVGFVELTRAEGIAAAGGIWIAVAHAVRVRHSDRVAATGRQRLLARLPKGEFFSLGSVLAACVRTRTPLAPWTLSAAILVALACWDPIARGGRFDMILLGLAAYELLIALTQPEPERKATRAGLKPCRTRASVQD